MRMHVGSGTWKKLRASDQMALPTALGNAGHPVGTRQNESPHARVCETTVTDDSSLPVRKPLTAGSERKTDSILPPDGSSSPAGSAPFCVSRYAATHEALAPFLLRGTPARAGTTLGAVADDDPSQLAVPP